MVALPLVELPKENNAGHAPDIQPQFGVAKSHERPLEGQDGTSRLSGSVDRSQPERVSLDFRRLFSEADVTGTAPAGSLLVDQDDYRHDPRLWSRLLQFRRRIYGIHGVVDIWKGLYQRRVVLPTHGTMANFLWHSFVDAALLNEDVLDQLLGYAEALFKDHGHSWNVLYEALITGFLRTDAAKAYRVHQRLKDWCPLPQGYLARIIRNWSGTSDSLYSFGHIYQESSVRDLYRVILPFLCRRRKYLAAYKWHRFLIQNGDVPRVIDPAKPLIHHLTIWGDPGQLDIVMNDLRGVKVMSAEPITKDNHNASFFSREDMNRHLGQVFSIPEKLVNDGFCARLFATKAFSVDVILSGLRVLGVDEIGPLALRELAVREGSPENVLRRIGRMREDGISIGSSRFSQLLHKFASDQSTELLTDLLASDQHPEVLEDRNLQEALLTSYLQANDIRQARKTLAVLSTFSRDPKALEYNLVLRSHLRQHNQPAVEQVLRDMGDAAVPLTNKSPKFILRTLLRTRYPGKMSIPVSKEQDDLGLTIRILFGALHSGSTLDPACWSEIFRRLGQGGRFDELERLALWLALLYSSGGRTRAKLRYAPSRAVMATSVGSADATFIPYHVRSSHRAHPLRKIFSPALLEAIVAWSFISGWKDGYGSYIHNSFLADDACAVRNRPWVRGLRLIRLLRDRGVYIQEGPIRKAFRQRLAILYGSGVSSKTRNRCLRQRNLVPVEVIVRDAELVWGSPLLDEQPERPHLISSMPRTPLHHPPDGGVNPINEDKPHQTSRIV